MQAPVKMTPRKVKQRQPQPDPAHPVSDYDSDFNTLNLEEAPLPPTTRTNTQLNLSVIQRYLPDVISIVSIASYAVVYLFSPTTQQWEKNGIEGTLFICELLPNPSASARYSVLVLNRRGLENFKLELLDSDDIDITGEYVILQGHDEEDIPKAYGLWIFSESVPSSTAQARDVNAKIIEECALRAKTGRISEEPQQQQHVNGQGARGSASGIAGSGTGVQATESMGWLNVQPSMNNTHQSNRTETKSPDILGELFRKATQSYRGSNQSDSAARL